MPCLSHPVTGTTLYAEKTRPSGRGDPAAEPYQTSCQLCEGQPCRYGYGTERDPLLSLCGSMFAKTLRVVGGVSIISRAVVASNRAVNAFGRDTMAPFATLGSVLEANAATRGNREAYKAVQQDVAWDFAELKVRFPTQELSYYAHMPVQQCGLGWIPAQFGLLSPVLCVLCVHAGFCGSQNRVDSFARGLLLNGYKKGSKLAVWMSNETEHVCSSRVNLSCQPVMPCVPCVVRQLVVQLAAARIGVTVISIDPSVGVKGVECVICVYWVPLTWRYCCCWFRSVLKAENCRGLVFSERYNGEHRAAALHAAIPEIDATLPGQTFASKRIRSMRHVVSTGFDEFEGTAFRIECGAVAGLVYVLSLAGMNYYREFPMAGDLQSFDAAVAAVSDADVALIQYVPATNADGVSRGKEFTQKVGGDVMVDPFARVCVWMSHRFSRVWLSATG